MVKNPTAVCFLPHACYPMFLGGKEVVAGYRGHNVTRSGVFCQAVRALDCKIHLRGRSLSSTCPGKAIRAHCRDAKGMFNLGDARETCKFNSIEHV